MIYVLQVQTGKELTVRSLLEQQGISASVPRERLLIRKDGMWSKKVIILFPGYVFVDIEYNAGMFYRINPVPGVIRFLGLPTPLPKQEEKIIRWLSNGGEVIEQSYAVKDENGHIVRYEGFLAGNEDKINHLNLRQKKASVAVEFDGVVHKVNIGVDVKKSE